MVDLFLYREPEEVNKDVEAEEVAPEVEQVVAPDASLAAADFSGLAQQKVGEWGAEENTTAAPAAVQYDTTAAAPVAQAADWNQTNWQQPAAPQGWESTQQNYQVPAAYSLSVLFNEQGTKS